MISIVAIDDEKLPLELIQNFCGKIEDVQLVNTFNQLASAKHYLETHIVDLLLLDIEMPESSGLDFYATLSAKPLLILCTAYDQYAIQGFEHNAIDYLLKPYPFSKFENAIIKAKNYLKGAKQVLPIVENKIVIKSNYGLVHIIISEIVYIECFADFLDIHFDNGTKQRLRITMKAILDKLPVANFVRVHRSFIICIGKINAIKNQMIQISDITIPIGKTYRNNVNELFK